MTSKSLRRIAADHASLHTAGLPPNYLFHPSTDSDSLSDLSVLLAGPDGTPFADGLFHLELTIPMSYPTIPPTAHFRTKIFHPNVDPVSGAVCVDTLKRDWTPDLTFRDILVTVYCLLACPNAASALNEEAGMLLEEDYAAFERRASLWASMYAAVPLELKRKVEDAKNRGEIPPNIDGLAATRPPKRERRKAGHVFRFDPETAENKRHGPVASSTSADAAITSRVDAVSEPTASRGLGLMGFHSGETLELVDAGTAPSQSRPAPATRHSRNRYQLNPPPPPNTSFGSISFSHPPATPTPVFEQPNATVASSTPRLRQVKRIRLTPPRHVPNTVTGFDGRSTSSSLKPPAEDYPWLEWHRKMASTPESRSARKSRMKFERDRLIVAGGCIKSYNSGAFGPRIGILRL